VTRSTLTTHTQLRVEGGGRDACPHLLGRECDGQGVCHGFLFTSTSHGLGTAEQPLFDSGLARRTQLVETQLAYPVVPTKSPSRSLHLVLLRQRQCWTSLQQVTHTAHWKKHHVSRLTLTAPSRDHTPSLAAPTPRDGSGLKAMRKWELVVSAHSDRVGFV
jgi:hypothetical protein